METHRVLRAPVDKLHNPWNDDDPKPVPLHDLARYFRAVDVGSVQ